MFKRIKRIEGCGWEVGQRQQKEERVLDELLKNCDTFMNA